MAARSSLEELELTGEEVERLRQAFRDERFRSLFAEYAAELADPAQRAVYEAEVVALERQRGVEARFLHPTPGWVLRTSQAGSRRCYLNVCSNALVGRPEARREAGGSRWSLPHCLSPAREELGRGPGAPRRLVYDVVFHPDALRLAARSARFRRLLDETALEAVERQFSPGLDRANAVPLRGTAYKGLPQASLLRTPLPGGAPPPAEDSPLPPCPSPYAYPPPQPAAAAPPRPPPQPAAAAPTTPRWTLRHRCYVDLQDYRCSRDSAPSPVPRELEVTVELPLLSSAAQAQLEVRGQELQLDSRRPAAYRLRLPLPYPVDEGGGRATFDKSKRRLVVTLPVRPKPGGVLGPGPGQEGPPEEEEQQQQPPGSGDSPPALDAPAGTRAETGQPGAGEQSLPVTHVGANHVELPVCAGESGPVAVGTSGPAAASEVCPAPLDVHVGSTPELPGDPETSDRVAPGAANRSLEAHACGRSPGASAAEGGPCASEDRSHEADRVPLDPEVCAGSAVELPVCRGLTSPASPVTEGGLGTDMDRKKCPETTDAVPLSDLGDATIPSTHLCGANSDHPAATECHNVSSPGYGMEACTSTDVSWYPGSCSNPVAPACSNAAPSADLSVTTISSTNGPPGSPLLSRTGLAVDPETALTLPSSPDSPEPPSSPPPPLCPPFQCTQDEEALMLLLHVPDIVPQSLKGEVSANHYRVSFASKDCVSYTLLLQLPPENKLSSPETGISVSLNNAVIHLMKAPETAGLWTKLYFGLNEDALQEKLFVTEDNVTRFLDSLQRPSCASQPEMECQPLIEVLDVSESKSRIQLKAQQHNSPEVGTAEEKVNPGTEDGERPFSAENCPLVTDPAGEHTVQTKKAFDSLTAVETKEPAGWGRHHCLEADPADSGLAAPGKSQIMESQEPELAFATDLRATYTEQMPLDRGEPAGTRGDVCSDSAESSGPAGPTLRETDMRDGSVQIISHHRTHCAVSFQNPLLYELD